ncbi:ComF family protein [Paraglaciecola sp.]|uniref:ComF family protein n=1 Tax=Paraglaciecola sp. TaxID=1920173 RepID=UPI003EF7CB4E
MMQKLFSQNCLICHQETDTLICFYCRSDLQLFDSKLYQHNLMHWPVVQKGLSKVSFPHILALCDYQWPISKLLTSLKFSAKLPNAKALAVLFSQNCLPIPSEKPQLIIPIPLHNNRFLMRKFNQSIEIAKHISQFAKIPINTELLSRIKSTKKQTELTALARKNNLRNAFSITSSANLVLAEYSHIVLFDDVITTGTTINSAYKLIQKHHPDLKIDVWSICLTLQV